MDDRVVITGTGLVTSLGNNAHDSWAALLAGKCGICSEDFSAHGGKCHGAAQVRGLGPEELDVHPRDSRIMGRHSFMLLKAARDAFRDAGLDKGTIAPEDIGFFGAMGMVDYNIDDLLSSVLKSLDEHGVLDYDRFFSGAYQEIHPLWPLSMLNNISFCQVAIDLGIKGENTTFSPHADSAVHSIIEAYNTLIEGKAQAVLAGGVSETVSPFSVARASLAGVLNNVDLYCSPFCKDRKGTILGEGCGIVALELLSSAQKGNKPCEAVITGYGSSFGKPEGSHAPSSEAIMLSMETAISMAEIGPSDIDLIIVHGDGTDAGDKNEINAINHTFEQSSGKLNVYSSKSALGHLLSGAPAADVVLGTYMLKNGIIPAVLNCPDLDENIKFNVVRDRPLKQKPGRILINSQSYEGQCSSLIIEAVDK